MELSLREMALKYGTSVEALRSASARGTLAVIKKWGRVYVPEDEVERYVRKMTARDTK